MSKPGDGSIASYAAVLIPQGKYRFYSAAMPIEELAATCFVTTRDEDPEQGFQRVLDEKRADEIAKYIDSGTGTIPTAVVLSAQPDSQFEYQSRPKTISFRSSPRTFLVLDGQHRVWGFRKANTNLRVPVIIYSGLNRQLESKLFIDINTKQRPVPNELLLDIKKLADAENQFETYAGTLFDLFHKTPTSVLKGRLSPDKRTSGQLSRVTFYRAMKYIVPTVGDIPPEQIFPVLNNYFQSLEWKFKEKKIPNTVLLQPLVFGAFVMLFPELTGLVGDKHDRRYSSDNFATELGPVFETLKKSQLDAKSIRSLYEHLSDALKIRRLSL